MRRLSRIGLAAALSVALLVAGCGRGGGSAGSGAEGKAVGAGPAKGDLTVWAMGTEGEKLQAFADGFAAENPGVKVKVTAVPWDAAHDKIATAITGRQTPDVSLIGSTWIAEFAKTGALDPIPAGLFDQSAYFPGAWQSVVVDGAPRVVPWYVETRVLYYRDDLASKAGVTGPPKSWADLTALAKAEQQSGTKWGFALQPGTTGAWETFLPLVWQRGGDVMSGGKCTLDSPEVTDALAYFKSFFDQGLAAKDMLPTGQLEQDFAKGGIGMFVSGPWHISLLKDAGASRYALAPMPTEKTNASFIGGSGLAVFKDAKNRDAAWKFIQYLSKPQVQVKWYQTVSDLPAVQKAWDDPVLSSDAKIRVFGEQLKTAKAPPAVATWEQIAKGIDNELEKVAKGAEQPAAAAKAMQSNCTSVGTGG
jgi:multiple sugar transport system substrate-binding protein